MQVLRIVVALLLLSTVACNPAEPLSRPIPEFSLPGSIDTYGVPDELRGDRTKWDGDWMCPTPTNSGWICGFKYALGWESLMRNVEDQMKTLGFKKYKGPEITTLPKIPGVKPEQMIRAWQSSDDKYMLVLGNLTVAKNRGYTTTFPVGDYFAIIDYTVEEARRRGMTIVGE